jgi:hypothetical protein
LKSQQQPEEIARNSSEKLRKDENHTNSNHDETSVAQTKLECAAQKYLVADFHFDLV